MNAKLDLKWKQLCALDDLVPHSGVAALIDGQQIALFYLPDQPRPLYAVSNHDPVSGANVIARGLIGDLKGEPMVASPLYKQHYRLQDGACLEQPEVGLTTWPVRINDKTVEIGSMD
ncbi:nitrite reductase small subunit NirD [Marinobacterium arenosum]|uniref:nitrite reductase small subunit NirD n=1 Tax=Marinobacterium arenosum TaxID=2862496 RepID=UPI001C93C3C7|nr:nitrite reductase small subunit NirD [Marinobacterium arenosum]MBY4675781.1 nitrite reductase small subunit NirD [Marinobacterium arenosum]